VELYNSQWLIEKNGYLSPLDAKKAYYSSASLRSRFPSRYPLSKALICSVVNLLWICYISLLSWGLVAFAAASIKPKMRRIGLKPLKRTSG